MTHDFDQEAREAAEKRAKWQGATGNEDLDMAIQFYIRIGFEDGAHFGRERGIREVRQQVLTDLRNCDVNCEDEWNGYMFADYLESRFKEREK